MGKLPAKYCGYPWRRWLSRNVARDCKARWVNAASSNLRPSKLAILFMSNGMGARAKSRASLTQVV